MNFNQLILGSHKIDDPQEERKILLGGYLIVLYLIVDFLLFFVNLVDPLGIPWVLVSGVVVSIISLLLLRKGRVNLAIFVFLLRANSIVFFFSRQEDINTGTFIYFLSYGITPLAFYGYQERLKGTLYSLITFLLFMIANFRIDNFHPHHPHFNFIINYAIVLLTLSMIILVFDRINRSALIKIKNQNTELTKTNDELDRFVYSVSHDLRSPLTSILGLVNVYGISPTEDEKRNVVNMIRERTLKLDEFIRKILDYSRNSRRELTMAPLNLFELINSTLESLEYMPNVRLIELRNELSPELVIISDEERLSIIFSNLLSNAIKYVDKNKEQRYVSISAEKKAEHIVISVADNGTGILPDRVGRIFEMFYRASEVSNGSGIGLYITKECVENLNGYISVKSEYGKGTTFTVLIPKLSETINDN